MDLKSIRLVEIVKLRLLDWSAVFVVAWALFVQPSSLSAQMHVGINLDGVADWGTPQWVDVLKQQREWSTRNADGSGDWNSGLAAQIPVDENGWATQVPFIPEDGLPEQIVHTLFPVSGPGVYKLTTEGTGRIRFVAGYGLLEPDNPYSGELILDLDGGIQSFDIEIFDSEFGDGTGLVFLEYLQSESSDHVRNMKLITPGHEETAGSLPFLPSYTDELAIFSNLRFMDWGSTNGNPLSNWSQRTTLNSYTQARPEGVSIEHIVQFANQANQDAWITIPAEADDDYVRRTAEYVRARLKPGLKVFVEYSNETWNFIFSQTFHAMDRGVELELHPDPWQAGQLFIALRSVQIWHVFEQEFGDQAADRLIKVMASQASSAFLSEYRMRALNNPAINPLNIRPDALAIAPYFGGAVADQIVEEGLVDSISIPEILDRAADNLRTDVTLWMQQHEALADEFDVWLITYEGGQHLVGNFENQNNETLTEKLIEANRHPGMYDLYLEYLDLMNAHNVVMHSNFSYVTEPSRYGSWGLQEYADQPLSEAPKLRGVVNWMMMNPPQNIPPIARAGADIQLIDDGNGFEFFDLDGSASRDFDGSILGYEWSLGRRKISGRPSLKWRLNLGRHELTLSVFDDQKLKSSENVVVTIAPQSAAETLVQSDFAGNSPSENTPWTSTLVEDRNVDFGGWVLGDGLLPYTIDDVFGFQGVFSGEPRTLEEAIANDEYISFTVEPDSGFEVDVRGAQFRFVVERLFYHAPRQFVVTSSIDGFSTESALFRTPWTDDQFPTEFDFTLPFDGYRTSGEIEFRIYMVGGQWGGHAMSINEFEIRGATEN